MALQFCNRANRQTDKPVGFYGPIVHPVPNAPISRICGQNPRNDADATFMDPHICVVDRRCTPPRRQYTAAARYDRREVDGMANFKTYLLRQFCSSRVEFFYNTQEIQTQKNHGPEF